MNHIHGITGFDERIIAMYARGMSVREIQGFVVESYGNEVSPDFISSATDEVMDETAIKLLWLALRNVLKKSVRAAFDWKSAMTANLHVYGYR